MSDFHDYVVEIIEGPGVVTTENVVADIQLIEIIDHEVDIVEIVEPGPQGPAGNPGLVLLQADEALPDPVQDGVLYLRLLN